jgi:hypothetical protein
MQRGCGRSRASRDFGFQPLPWLEAVAQHAEKQEADCDHSADHVLIRRQPRVKWMEFSEATRAPD